MRRSLPRTAATALFGILLSATFQGARCAYLNWDLIVLDEQCNLCLAATATGPGEKLELASCDKDDALQMFNFDDKYDHMFVLKKKYDDKRYCIEFNDKYLFLAECQEGLSAQEFTYNTIDRNAISPRHHGRREQRELVPRLGFGYRDGNNGHNYADDDDSGGGGRHYDDDDDSGGGYNKCYHCDDDDDDSSGGYHKYHSDDDDDSSGYHKYHSDDDDDSSGGGYHHYHHSDDDDDSSGGGYHKYHSDDDDDSGWGGYHHNYHDKKDYVLLVLKESDDLCACVDEARVDEIISLCMCNPSSKRQQWDLGSASKFLWQPRKNNNLCVYADNNNAIKLVECSESQYLLWSYGDNGYKYLCQWYSDGSWCISGGGYKHHYEGDTGDDSWSGDHLCMTYKCDEHPQDGDRVVLEDCSELSDREKEWEFVDREFYDSDDCDHERTRGMLRGLLHGSSGDGGNLPVGFSRTRFYGSGGAPSPYGFNLGMASSSDAYPFMVVKARHYRRP